MSKEIDALDRFSLRVWNKEERKMYYNAHSFNEIVKNKNNLIPMMCAIRKDVNDKLIYGGDLLKVKQNKIIVEVVWDAEIEAMWIMGKHPMLDKPNWRIIHYMCISSDDEIVGNIYENPEILETAKEK